MRQDPTGSAIPASGPAAGAASAAAVALDAYEDPHAGTPLAGVMPAEAYADTLMASERTRPSVLTKSFEVPGGAVMGKLAYAIPLIGFVLAILFWGIFGGVFKSMDEGKRAVLPIPPGAQQVMVRKDVTTGPMGILSEERQTVFATRIFLVPKPVGEIIAYYRSGEGAAALKKEGWTESESWHNDETRSDNDYKRFKSLGFLPNGKRANEEQVLSLCIDDGAGPAPYQLPDSVQAQLSPNTCIVRIHVLGAALEEVSFREPKP